MSSHAALFIIGDRRIRSYLRRDSHLELQRFEGEEGFSLNRGLDDFWFWWMRMSGYVRDQDQVDFVLLTEQGSGVGAFFPDGLVPVEKSAWQLGQIASLLCQLLPGSRRIRLSEGESVQTCPGSFAQGGQGRDLVFELSSLPRRSFLDGSPVHDPVAGEVAAEAATVRLEKGGAVSDYFREKTERIRNTRL